MLQEEQVMQTKFSVFYNFLFESMRKLTAKIAKKYDLRKAKIVKRIKSEIFGFHVFSLMRSENFKAKKMRKKRKYYFSFSP